MGKINICKYVSQCRKILGAGLNYKSAAKEKGLPIPREPIVFMKPSTSLVTEDKEIEIPKGYEVFHEVELGIIIGKKGKCIDPEEVPDHIGGYLLALDLTANNVLEEAKKQGLPWTMSKSFDTACPVSEAITKECLPCPDKVNLWLKVNDVKKQEGSTNDMIFTPNQLISYISRTITLEPFDIILTGTPCGVGPIRPGDTICAGLGNLIAVKFHVR